MIENDMTNQDPYVLALASLCEKRGGWKAVAAKIGTNDQTLYQITTGKKLPSGNPRGVGPKLRSLLDEHFPGWPNHSHTQPHPHRPPRRFFFACTHRPKKNTSFSLVFLFRFARIHPCRKTQRHRVKAIGLCNLTCTCSGTLKQPGEAEREPRTANRQRTGNGATTVRGHAEVTPAWLGWWVPLSSNSRKATKTRRQILICQAQPVRPAPVTSRGPSSQRPAL